MQRDSTYPGAIGENRIRSESKESCVVGAQEVKGSLLAMKGGW